jgi:uncharacterized protein
VVRRSGSTSLSEAWGDTVFYSLWRFVELAAQANPNLIELLFMPEDCIVGIHRAFEAVLDARHLFVTRAAYDSHIGYAQAQLRKARGQNKWINPIVANPDAGSARIGRE